MPNRMTRTPVQRQVQRDVHERKRRPVITTTFRRQHVSHVCRYVFVGKFTPNDGLGENGIGGRHGRGDQEGG